MKHTHRGLGRRLGASLVLALAAACVAAGAHAAGRPTSGSASWAGDTTQPVRAGRLFALRATAAFWGGTYTANTGEPVQIEVSDAYPQDPALPQRWADYLASLVHGEELASLTAYLAPFDEVQSICGEDALACYSSQAQTLVAPAENPGADLDDGGDRRPRVRPPRGREPPQHAVARHRLRHQALGDHMNVCAPAGDGDVYPGAEDAEHYELNPGEGFAEAYRVLNQQQLGQPLLAWQIVSPTFFPDTAALQRDRAGRAHAVDAPDDRRASPDRSPRASRGRPRSRRRSTGPRASTLRVSRGAVTADVLAGARRLARVTRVRRPRRDRGRSRSAASAVCACG